MKIAIQGIKGSFHEMAALKYFGKDIEIVNCDKFRQIFESVQSGNSEYGIAAIENTIGGSILENYGLLKTSKLKITGEISLHITQNFMALPGTNVNEIREVYSHPAAILQSAEFFSSYPEMKLIEWSGTASSAKKISDEKLNNTAAIASEYAAELYGLEILAREIETNKRNYTRFVVIQRRPDISNENNKSSLCFELGHKPGTLADVLYEFKKHEINLTKIESLPIIGSPYQYNFYVDLEWKVRKKYESALNNVIKIVSNLSMLGEYKRDENFNHEVLK